MCPLIIVLVDSSVKVNHPLNAFFLHTFLSRFPLAIRDYVWTININSFNNDESGFYQLVKDYHNGDCELTTDSENIELLLILLTWFLTSSNRVLRDKTSKAMIEILRFRFDLCLPLLKRFEAVDDPYVIQRLYGVVFGACMKRLKDNKNEFEELSSYVYRTIFDNEEVYPDILLRDYARLIVDRYCFEYPSDSVFDKRKLHPPYKSTSIPNVKKEEYYKEGIDNWGFNAIAFSMHPDCGPAASYGDFGRYVFEYACKNFERVDIENLYHYAMQFIRDELKYDNKLFSSYDNSLKIYCLSRSNINKTERIGKKYEWIVMYNILARLSDNNLLHEYDGEPHSYNGAWELSVRDFDPTLNLNKLQKNNPRFAGENDENDFVILSDTSRYDIWIKTFPDFYNDFGNKLLIKDENGNIWVTLEYYKEINNMPDGSPRFKVGSGEIWVMSHGYFVKQSDLAKFKEYLFDKNYLGRRFPEAHSCYQSLFNREFAWAPGVKDIFEESWIEYEVPTDEVVEIEHDELSDLLGIYERTKYNYIGKILPSYIQFVWEKGYDSSNEEGISINIPCKEIVSCLHLEQKEADGYFYDSDGNLVAFDGTISGCYNGLVIRQEYLDKFLRDNKLRIFWLAFGEKNFFLSDNFLSDNKIARSEWGGFFFYERGKIIGTIENKDGKPYVI